MNVRPTETSSSRAKMRSQRQTPLLRLLIVVAFGLAMLGLALAIPARIAASAAKVQSSTADPVAVTQYASGLTSENEDLKHRAAASSPAGLSI